MTREEAKLILQCRRPCGKDDHLPVMREARSVVETCPDTMAELEAECALDGLIAERVRSVDPPADLLRNILLGAKVTPMQPWWRRHSGVLAAAAALAVAGVILGIPRQPQGGKTELTSLPKTTVTQEERIGPAVPLQPTLADFRVDTTSKLSADKVSFQISSNSVAELQSYVNNHTRIRRVPVPDPMNPLPTLGCEIFQWRGHEVTLICFNTEEFGTVHLFTIDAADLPGCSAGCTDALAGGWQTVTWKDGDRVLLIAGKAPAEDLRKLIAKG